jgi:Ion channel
VYFEPGASSHFPGRATEVDDMSEVDGYGTAIRWGAAIERRRPGMRYGVVLLLLLATYVFMAAGPVGRWVPLVTALLQGATLLVALLASGARRGLVQVALILIAVAVVSGVVALIAGGDEARGVSALLSLFLVAVAPVSIALAIRRRPVIDVHMVLGAICIYVFIGLLFALAFIAIGDLESGSFFAQIGTATPADYLYFSFVTMTTVGYGDLTAASGFGRATAVIEALLGQVYLVTVVALFVSHLARGRARDDGSGS